MSAYAAGGNSKEKVHRALDEKKVLKQEELALKETLKKLKAQQTQLQVEALDIKARIRQQTGDHQKETFESTKKMNVESSDADDDINAKELDLGVNANAVLDKMIRGQVTQSTNEEEDSD